MPFPDRDSVLFPRHSEPELQDSENVKPVSGGSLEFFTGTYDRTSKEDSGRLSGGCCPGCCGVVCEVSVGTVTYKWDYLQITRPYFHPDGGADQEVNIEESYEFVPWSELGGQMRNLPPNSYTGVQLSSDSYSNFFTPRNCYCSRFLVFSPITSPQKEIEVTIYLGGDIDDYGSYFTGTVIVQAGLAMAYDDPFHSGQGGMHPLIATVAAWNIGGSPFYGDPFTDWGTYAGSTGHYLGDFGGLRCNWIPFFPDEGPFPEFDPDELADVEYVTFSGPVKVSRCSPTSLDQSERRAEGFPEFPVTFADPNVGRWPLALDYYPR